MRWENLLGCKFSFLFTQHKFAKGKMFTKALPKDKPNPERAFYDHIFHGYLQNKSFFV